MVFLLLAFTENQIVPDVLTRAPSQLLTVKYPKSGKAVNLGKEIAPVDVREEPEVTYHKAEPGSYYTLIFTDPDAPSRASPTRREFRHWLVVNIPGTDFSKGQVLNAYVGSGPPNGTGLHRYIFLLYKQRGQIEFEETFVGDTEVGNRALLSAKKFAAKYNLEIEAGNFYQAQYDDSVLELLKKFGITPPKV